MVSYVKGNGRLCRFVDGLGGRVRYARERKDDTYLIIVSKLQLFICESQFLILVI